MGFKGEKKSLYHYTNSLFVERHDNAGDIAVAGKFFMALHIFGYFLARPVPTRLAKQDPAAFDPKTSDLLRRCTGRYRGFLHRMLDMRCDSTDSGHRILYTGSFGTRCDAPDREGAG